MYLSSSRNTTKYSRVKMDAECQFYLLNCSFAVQIKKFQFYLRTECGLKGHNRGTSESGTRAAAKLATKALDKGFRDMYVVFKKFGPGRDAAFRSLAASGLEKQFESLVEQMKHFTLQNHPNQSRGILCLGLGRRKMPIAICKTDFSDFAIQFNRNSFGLIPLCIR